MTIYYNKTEKPDKASVYYNRIEKLRNDGYKENKDISLKLAEAAFKMISCYGKMGEIGLAGEYYNRIEKLWNDGYNDDKDISSKYTDASMLYTIYKPLSE